MTSVYCIAGKPKVEFANCKFKGMEVNINRIIQNMDPVRKGKITALTDRGGVDHVQVK